MGKYQSTKVIDLGSAAFRQPKAESHCKFIHGYRLKAKIWLGANELDSNNWVFDFGSFKELRQQLEKTFDHKLVIDKSDPAKPAFRELERYGAVEIVEMEGVGIEKFAEFVFNQTDNFVKFKTQNRVWCERVEVFEHENNSALYIKQEKTNNCDKDSAKTSEPKLESATGEQTPQLHAATNQPMPAAVGNNITTGWSNPFAGTSWGS
jgi:6-pyruvoyltetrahydropterin/6-carboxytetrahydropterin synthase